MELTGRARSALRGLAFAALASRAAVAPAAEEPRKAEYAVRWNPAEGGLKTADAVLALLGSSGARGNAWEIRYFDLPRPDSAPPGSAVILRRRAGTDGDVEIRLKYRSAHPLSGGWACPAGIAFGREAQVDVGFGGADAPSRVYSYSCKLAAPEPPAPLRATPRPCASRMVRFEAGSPKADGYKVEEWTLPDGTVRLEISRTAANSVDELARFADLAARLRARGVRPLDESKTELGGRCP